MMTSEIKVWAVAPGGAVVSRAFPADPEAWAGGDTPDDWVDDVGGRGAVYGSGEPPADLAEAVRRHAKSAIFAAARRAILRGVPVVRDVGVECPF